MSRPRLIVLLLALTTLVVFLPVGSHSFVSYDDPDYVTENSFVKNGLNWTDIRWALTAFHSGNWHPLTWISHMIDCSLFGPNAGAHHFVNVLFHAINSALLFILLWRWTNRLWPCAFIAALFAWHPLHVESVAWIAERKDVLSTFFALLALLSYTKFVRGKCRRSFWLTILFFALGLMAKPMLVTLPFVLLLVDFWPLNRMGNPELKIQNLKPLLLEKIPFFALTAISCVITFFAQKEGEAVVSLARMSLRYRLENALVATAAYGQKLFLPTDLCILYPLPLKIPLWLVLASVTPLILISVFAWQRRQKNPYVLMGWLWFIGTLVPVIGLVQVGGQAMADRYTYIPSIGFFIAVVFLLDDFAAKIQTPKMIAAGFAAVILTGCVLATEYQLQFWRDSETLFRRAIAVTTNNDIALLDLGVALDVQGRFDEALVVYRESEKIGSDRHQIHNNLGNVFDKLGRHAESLAEYQQAVQLRPNDAYLHNSVGSEFAALGQYDAAMKEFAEAQRLNANYAQPHMEIAKVFFQQGRDLEAVSELRTALRLEPENYQILAAAAHYLAANENDAARDGPSALVLAIKANVLSGRVQPMVFDVLGMACAATGDFTNAQVCAQNAIELGVAAKLTGLEIIQHRWELYGKHQPWRESFRATNAPAKN